MRQWDLLASFAILMRAARLEETHASGEEDYEKLSPEEQGHRLCRSFISIQDSAVRQAIIVVVSAIASSLN
ncbi:hypothetical protein MHY1_02932 [Methylovirgula sp. HY1]|nr:hypothetical protein MHY1_02932 [Methylovirgula sp. HY1]